MNERYIYAYERSVSIDQPDKRMFDCQAKYLCNNIITGGLYASLLNDTYY